MKLITTLLFCLGSLLAYSQDTIYLKVHFLYGSKPLKAYKESEPKWFGGVLGGHVGIESDSNDILNFLPSGEFHLFSKQDERNSRFALHTEDNFYAMFGSDPDSVKKTIIYIPISALQKQKFDSIATVYLNQTPYDYAFFGMRCGAAAYDVLGQLGILTEYDYQKTYRKIFYPKKLRKPLLEKAKQNDWTIEKHAGSISRKWEKD